MCEDAVFVGWTWDVSKFSCLFSFSAGSGDERSDGSVERSCTLGGVTSLLSVFSSSSKMPSVTSTDFGSFPKFIISEIGDVFVVSEMTDVFLKKSSKSSLANLIFLRIFSLNFTTELSGFSLAKFEKLEFEFKKVFLISGNSLEF